MQRVLEQVQRIRALIPVPIGLADCDVLARADLVDVSEWLNAVEPRLRDLSPPFQVAELGNVYAWASQLDVHADRAARRDSVSRPFTELARQQLQQKYGATEYLRRRWADEPDDPVARINAGIEDAVYRFPDLERWTADDWSSLFFCSLDIVTQTSVWHDLQSRRTPQVPAPLTAHVPSREQSVSLITDPKLRADPLWLALDRAIRSIHEDRRILMTKEPAWDKGCNSEAINRLALEAQLGGWPVFEVGDELQSNIKTERWLKVHHPDVDEPVEIVFWKRYGTVQLPDAKVDRLLNYLAAWRDKRATQLKPTAAKQQAPDSKKRFRVALSFPGERRDFVSKVANHLAAAMGDECILYDKFYEAEFARPNLDTYLQTLYHDESELVCVFLCEEYEQKDWCGLEWRAIRDIIKRRRESDIMPLRFDMTEVSGLFSTDGYVWIPDKSPEKIAELIVERLTDRTALIAQSPVGTQDTLSAETQSAGDVKDVFAVYRESRIQAIRQGKTPIQLETTPKLVCHMIPKHAFEMTATFGIPDLKTQLPNFPLLVFAGGMSSRPTLDGLLITETAYPTAAEFGYTEVRKNGIIESVACNATTRNRLDSQSPPFFVHDLVHETIRSVRLYLRAYAELGIAPPIYCFLSLLGVRGMMLYWPGFGRTASPVEVEDILLEPITCNQLLLEDCTELLKPAFDTIWNAGGLDYCPLFNKEN